MRKLLLGLLIGIFTLSFLITDASAKRFGGGKSFGMSRQSSSFSRNQTTTANAAPSAAAAKPAAASGGNKWLGPLAGLAAGGLLASLFMGHGIGTGILSWLLIGFGIFFLWRFIRSRLSHVQPMQNAALQTSHNTRTAPVSLTTPAQTSHVEPTAYPNQFDETAFLRGAKTLFIRLQTAYDSNNLADIREFTAPEVFAEIQMQLQERGETVNQTEVINIHANLLDLSIESNRMIASVLFEGLVREEVNSSPIAINEIWHFTKTNDSVGPNWLVAGIEQQNR